MNGLRQKGRLSAFDSAIVTLLDDKGKPMKNSTA